MLLAFRVGIEAESDHPERADASRLTEPQLDTVVVP